MGEPGDVRFMRRAVELAAGVPGRPFAAVIARADTGEVVAEGVNRTAEHPLWHGEVDAINRLVAAGRTADPGRLVLYTTAEPCPMCQAAILWAGIGRVVFGTSIRFLTAVGWAQIDIPAAEVVARGPGWRCPVEGGVLEAECDELFLAAARAAPGR